MASMVATRGHCYFFAPPLASVHSAVRTYQFCELLPYTRGSEPRQSENIPLGGEIDLSHESIRDRTAPLEFCCVEATHHPVIIGPTTFTLAIMRHTVLWNIIKRVRLVLGAVWLDHGSNLVF